MLDWAQAKRLANRYTHAQILHQSTHIPSAIWRQTRQHDERIAGVKSRGELLSGLRYREVNVQ
jgi:hypothetical protein